MIVNFAERAHNHNWELDPVTRSLLDTDFYKLLMLQFIWKNYPKTQVQFTAVQSLFQRSGRHFRARRAHRATGSRAQAPLSQVGTGLAGRQHFLWPAWNL